MKVTGTVPTDFTIGALPTSPWNCGKAGQVLTCTNMNAIAQGSTYQLLTIPVKVVRHGSRLGRR